MGRKKIDYDETGIMSSSKKMMLCLIILLCCIIIILIITNYWKNNDSEFALAFLIPALIPISNNHEKKKDNIFDNPEIKEVFTNFCYMIASLVLMVPGIFMWPNLQSWYINVVVVYLVASPFIYFYISKKINST
jgi:hypothetical protein